MKLVSTLQIFALSSSFILACSSDSSSDGPEFLPDEVSLGLTLPQGLIVDDFSDCESEFKTQIDSYWYTFTDVNDGGDSTTDKERLEVGLVEDSCALRWTGKVTTRFQYGYVGLGFDLAEIKLSDYSGIYLVTRGEGRNFRLKFPMSEQLENNETDFHGVDFACGNGSQNWQAQAISFAEFQQEGWGASRSLDLSQVTKIQFQSIGQPIPNFQCDIAAIALTK